MNYFLILIILGLCGGGYYEYTALETKNAQDVQVMKLDLQGKADQLQTENEKLKSDNADMTKNLKADADTITDLTSQIQTVQAKLAEAEAAAAAAKSGTATTPTTTSASASTSSFNNLGTIVTLDGKTYANSQLLKVNPDGITVNYDAGITKVLFLSLSPDMQKRFGFDPHQGTALTDAQVQTLETQRQAAAQMTAGK